MKRAIDEVFSKFQIRNLMIGLKKYFRRLTELNHGPLELQLNILQLNYTSLLKDIEIIFYNLFIFVSPVLFIFIQEC